VRPDGEHADVQMVRDLLVCSPFPESIQYVSFSIAQIPERRRLSLNGKLFFPAIRNGCYPRGFAKK
jgi:hypothetical protein